MSGCQRCAGRLIPGWEPGVISCLRCGYERYPRTLLEEIARAEVEANAAASPAKQAHMQSLAARRRAGEWSRADTSGRWVAQS